MNLATRVQAWLASQHSQAVAFHGLNSDGAESMDAEINVISSLGSRESESMVLP